MMSVQAAITRFRRDMLIGALARGALAVAAATVLVAPAFSASVDSTLAFIIILALWLAISYQGMKSTRLAASSPSLIASGQYDEAERNIEGALRSFTFFRAAKIVALHHLAMLRHAQRRWQETAALCHAVLNQKLGSLRALQKSSQLMLADSLLETNDLEGAYAAIDSLYRQRLMLAEALQLLVVQLDYLSRIGAWDQVLQAIGTRLQLAELLPTRNAARVQAFMALAARKLGREPLAEWLRRRVELLADARELARERPVLWQLWSKD